MEVQSKSPTLASMILKAILQIPAKYSVLFEGFSLAYDFRKFNISVVNTRVRDQYLLGFLKELLREIRAVGRRLAMCQRSPSHRCSLVCLVARFFFSRDHM